VHPGVVCGDRPGTVLREAGHENTFVKAGTGDPDMATEATLAEWIDYVFDHPVEDPAWHFSIDSPRLDLTPARPALTSDTNGRQTCSGPFSDAQIYSVVACD
jgi:hypothetical protein